MIRKVTEKDLVKIRELNECFVPKVSSVTVEWFRNYLRESEAFYVFTEGDEILGFLLAMLPSSQYQSENFLWFKKNETDFLYIDRIAVSSAAQGRGVGKALYGHVEKEWRGRVKYLTCEVNIRPENPQSYHFHLQLGFSEVGQQETKGGAIRVAMLRKNM
jgi:predicted GNAT superfamily acetyltransferase